MAEKVTDHNAPRDRMLFVYGSLMREMNNNHYFDDDGAFVLGEYTTEPKYKLISLGHYPAALLNGHTSIVGELWQVSKRIWNSVEKLEGYPRLYKRIHIDTLVGTAYMYVLAKEPDQYTPITSGDWRLYNSKLLSFNTSKELTRLPLMDSE